MNSVTGCFDEPEGVDWLTNEADIINKVDDTRTPVMLLHYNM